jgi:hypothetical protein
MPSNHRLVNLPYVGDWRPLRSLYDLVQVTVDSVLTPLMAWTRLDLYPGIFIALLNDGANEVTVTIETSEDGVLVDSGATYTIVAAPGTQGSVELSSTQMLMRRYWRVSAIATGAPSDCRWCLKVTGPRV